MQSFNELEQWDSPSSEIEELSSELESVLEEVLVKNPETLSSEVIETIKDAAFNIVIDKHLIDVFTESLYDNGYIEDEKGESEFMLGLQELSREEQLATLSIPKELRETQFNSLKERGVEVKDIPNVLYEQAIEKGYTVGFHVSPHEIRSDTREENSAWNIVGTEIDDRDDRPMAYYSLDHRNLYRKKRGNHVYMVRAQIGEGTNHKRDTSNNWGRAPLLSVISQMDNLSDTEDLINKAIEKLKKSHS